LQEEQVGDHQLNVAGQLLKIYSASSSLAVSLDLHTIILHTRQCIIRSYTRSSDPTSKPDQLRPVEARPEIQKSYILMAPLFCSNSGSQLEGVLQIPRGSMFASAAASAAGGGGGGGGIIILTCMIFEIRSTNSLHS
jgi:hypothetical protein